MALSVLYMFSVTVNVVSSKMGGAFMNIEQLQKKLENLLEQLKQELPRAERISLVEEIKEILSFLFPSD